MTSDEYEELMQQLENAARIYSTLLVGIDDEQLALAERTVGMAEGVGCFIDPTAHREAVQDGRLRRQRALIKAARSFRDQLRAAGFAGL